MTEVNIEVIDDMIVVTTSGYRVGFRKKPDSPHLIRSEFSTDEALTEMSLNEFLALAWQAANDKARKLRWIL